MGKLGAILDGLRSSSDEATEAASKGSDTSKSLEDTFASNGEQVQDFRREVPDGVNSGGGYADFEGDSYPRRLLADTTGRFADGSTPAAIGGRIAGETTSGLAKTTKYAGGTAVGLGGLYTANEVSGEVSAFLTQESKEQSYEEYVAAREAVNENDNLTPEQKEQRRAQLKEAYEEAVENPDNGTLPTGNITGLLTSKWGIALAIIVAVWVAKRRGN